MRGSWKRCAVPQSPRSSNHTASWLFPVAPGHVTRYAESMIDFEKELNPVQLDAVRHIGGPLLVLAGAGSGKTRVITYKIAHLILENGFNPWEILAVTFTNRAAGEMRERVAELLGPEGRDVWLGTFHSICLRLLRRHADLTDRTSGFVVYDDDDRKRLLERVIRSLNIAKDTLNARKAAGWIDTQQHHLRGPDHAELPVESFIDRLCVKVYAAYEKTKRTADAFDFGDLIFQAVRLFSKHPPLLSEYQYRWRYILVDEFQDTDHAQYKLIRMLAGDTANVCVVGDDDQSIYRWRGAEVGNILGFPNDFPGHTVETVRLEQNYRSTENILKAASGLISCNQHRHEKVLWTEDKGGDRVQLHQADTESGEARWVVGQALARHREGVALRDIAVFYRTHAQSRHYEDSLRSHATPYVVVGGLKFYQRKEVKDVLAYLRLAHNPNDDVALMRVINEPPRGIGQTTLKKASVIAADEETSLYDGLLRLIERPEGSRPKKAVDRFRRLNEQLRKLVTDDLEVFRVAEAVLAETGYIKRLQDEGTFEAQSRKENVDELMVSIQNWSERAEDRSLSAFLDHVSLLSSLDENSDRSQDAMILMTVHAAKGLEFDTVFVTGLEENVFPHFNSSDSDAIEEERRLAYVAITRAKKQVTLSWARSRQRFGRTDFNPPSRFVHEIPKEACHQSVEDRFSGSSLGDRGGWSSAKSSASTWTHASDERELDFGDSQSAEGGVGAQVTHPSFGFGTIKNMDGDGPNARVTVHFKSVGTKKIVARFLQFVE